MPVNKSALIRYMALDRCLQRKYHPYTLERLHREVNRCLEDAGYSQSDNVSLRTLYADLKFMESDAGFAAPIIRVKKNGHKLYYYDDPEFSAIGIYSSLHNEGLELIAQTKGILPFEWIIEKLHIEKHPLIKKRALIRYTHNPFVSGLIWVKKLYELMLEEVAATIKVNSNKTILEYQIHPWQLREYRGRWFILGKENTTSEIPIIIALEDVITIEAMTEIDYICENETDWDELYDDVVGPFPGMDKIPQMITLIADEDADRMLKNDPLHHSQKRKQNADGKFEYQYKLIINSELVRQLLAFGPSVVVFKPEILLSRMKDLTHRMNIVYASPIQICK